MGIKVKPLCLVIPHCPNTSQFLELFPMSRVTSSTLVVYYVPLTLMLLPGLVDTQTILRVQRNTPRVQRCAPLLAPGIRSQICETVCYGPGGGCESPARGGGSQKCHTKCRGVYTDTPRIVMGPLTKWETQKEFFGTVLLCFVCAILGVLFFLHVHDMGDRF